MKILITGCNGQLGNELQLLEKEHEGHTYYNTDVSELDITDPEAVECFVHDNRIDGVVNCAAYTAVDKAEDNDELCSRLNAEAPANLARAINRQGGWMIQISTDYVFNGQHYLPYTEDEDTCPASVYGRTKLVGELNVLKFCQKSMVIRTAWLFSTFGNNFVKTMIRLGHERPELGVVFDRDRAVAIMTVIDKGIVPGIYHFTNEGIASWYDFALAIHRIAGITQCHVRPLHTAEYPTAAQRPPYSVLDKSKIKATYGIEIPHWEDSVAECIKKLTINH